MTSTATNTKSTNKFGRDHDPTKQNIFGILKTGGGAISGRLEADTFTEFCDLFPLYSGTDSDATHISTHEHCVHGVAIGDPELIVPEDIHEHIEKFLVWHKGKDVAAITMVEYKKSQEAARAKRLAATTASSPTPARPSRTRDFAMQIRDRDSNRCALAALKNFPDKAQAIREEIAEIADMQKVHEWIYSTLSSTERTSWTKELKAFATRSEKQPSKDDVSGSEETDGQGQPKPPAKPQAESSAPGPYYLPGMHLVVYERFTTELSDVFFSQAVADIFGDKTRGTVLAAVAKVFSEEIVTGTPTTTAQASSAGTALHSVGLQSSDRGCLYFNFDGFVNIMRAIYSGNANLYKKLCEAIPILKGIPAEALRLMQNPREVAAIQHQVEKDLGLQPLDRMMLKLIKKALDGRKKPADFWWEKIIEVAKLEACEGGVSAATYQTNFGKLVAELNGLSRQIGLPELPESLVLSRFINSHKNGCTRAVFNKFTDLQLELERKGEAATMEFFTRAAESHEGLATRPAKAKPPKSDKGEPAAEAAAFVAQPAPTTPPKANTSGKGGGGGSGNSGKSQHSGSKSPNGNGGSNGNRGRNFQKGDRGTHTGHQRSESPKPPSREDYDRLYARLDKLEAEQRTPKQAKQPERTSAERRRSRSRADSGDGSGVD
jgi:hypothetical protein